MTDPLSVAASVGGLALLAKEIVQGTSLVIESVRVAKAEMRNLSNSIANLYGILKGLGLILDQLPSTEIATPGKLIYNCSATLENIQKLLAKCGSNDNIEVSPVAGPPPSRLDIIGKPSTWDATKRRAVWIVKKHEIQKLLDDLEGHKSMLLLAMTQHSLSGIVEVLRRQDETMSDLKGVKETQARMYAAQIAGDSRRLREDQKKILDDLSDLHPETSWQKHLGLRQDGTGLWFMNSPAFGKFQTSPNSRLWLYGIPRAGKSVLSAAIIDSLQHSEKMGVAFFFCEYGNRATQTIRQILGSIAWQLAVQSSNSFAALEDFYNMHDGSHPLSKICSDSEWVELVQDVSASFDTTTIIIDGLDECLENRSEIVRNLARLSSRGSIKTLFASREELDIKEDLSAFDSLPIAADRADVRLYVAAHLDSRFKQMTSKDPKLRQDILENLVDKSEGMFQWVKCQLDHLESLPSNRLRRAALNDLPPDLPQTYQRILQRAVTSQRQSTLKFMERTLRWMALAVRPMSISAIAEAISVEPGENEYDGTLEIERILKPCSSLIRNVEGIVSFSHFSVKEYLYQIETKDQELARFRVNKDHDQDYLASVCLSYLLLNDFSALDFQEPTSWDRHTADRPFYDYAAFSWFDHARNSSDSLILELELELFKPEKSDQFCLWAYKWLLYYKQSKPEQVASLEDWMYGITPLHLACICRLPEVVDNLIKKGVDVNRSNHFLQTPLVCAFDGWAHAHHGNTVTEREKGFQIIKRLLSENLSFDKSINDLLYKATKLADERVVALLLEEGFAVTRDVLKPAVDCGDDKLADTCLTHTTPAQLDPKPTPMFKTTCSENRPMRNWNGDKNMPPKESSEDMKRKYKEMLPIAASYGRLETVSGLLSCLPTMPKEENNELLCRCLLDAAANGQTDVVNFFVEEGISPSVQRKSDGRTALHEVALGGDLKMISTLLQSCQDPRSALEIKDHHDLTPWLCAIQAGEKDVLDYFLKVHPDIDLEQKTTLGLTAAHLAIISGNESIFHYLQERSVDFKSRTAHGQRPIHMLLESSWATNLDCQAKARILKSLIILEDDMSTMSGSKTNLIHLLVDAGKPSGDKNEILRDVLNDVRYRKSRENALVSTDSHLRTPLHLSLKKLCNDLRNPDLDLRHHLNQIRLLANPPFEFRGHHSIRGPKLCTPVLAFARSVSNIEVMETLKHQFKCTVSEVFRILLEPQKDAWFSRQQDHEGMTAMHYIAESKSEFPFKHVVSMFLKYEIDFSIKDGQGDTPVMVAARSESKNIDFLRLTLPRIKAFELEELCGDKVPLVHHICKKPGVEQLLPNYLAEFAQSTVLDEGGHLPLVHLLKSITDLDAAPRIVEVAGKTIDACDDMNHNCLYWACRLGVNPVVAALIDRYKTIDDPLLDQQPDGSARRNPPLLVAALHWNVDTVRLLIQKGADVFVKGEGSWQLHHCAIAGGYPPLLEFMETIDGFDFEAPITIHIKHLRHTRRFDNSRALHLAAIQRNTAPLEWLLANIRNLRLDPKTACGITPLHMACRGANFEACKMLLTTGSSPFEAQRNGFTPLHLACLNGSLGLCQYLLSNHGNLDVANTQAPMSPVEIASRNRDISMVKILLDHDCPVSATAELYALSAGNLELADLIREQLAKKKDASQCKKGTSEKIASKRLEIICQNKPTEIALLSLIPRIGNLDQRVTAQRETPLHVASRLGWVNAVSALIDRGASLNLLDNLSNTPLLSAAEAGQLECTKILYQNGSQLTQWNERGSTGLHLAAMKGDCDSLAYFLDQGLDVDAEDEEGRTALHCARELGCIDLLLRRGADPFKLSGSFVSPLSELSREDMNGERTCKILTGQPEERVQEIIDDKMSWCNATLLLLRHSLHRVGIG